jgi:hypothetical protein
MGDEAASKTKRDWLAFGRRDNLTTKVVLLLTVPGSILFCLARFGVVWVANSPVACKFLKAPLTRYRWSSCS